MQSEVDNTLHHQMRTRCLSHSCTRQNQPQPGHEVQCDGCYYWYCGSCCPCSEDENQVCPACQRGGGSYPACTVGGFV